MPAFEVDGSDVEMVWNIASDAIEHIRAGNGPTFILAHYINPHGHFLHDPIMSATSGTFKETMKIGLGLIKSATALKGASISARMESLKTVTSLIGKKTKEKSMKNKDPIILSRNKLHHNLEQIQEIESEVEIEIGDIVKQALSIYQRN